MKAQPLVMLCSFPMNSHFAIVTEVSGRATKLGTCEPKFLGKERKESRQFFITSLPVFTRITVSIDSLMFMFLIVFGPAFRLVYISC